MSIIFAFFKIYDFDFFFRRILGIKMVKTTKQVIILLGTLWMLFKKLVREIDPKTIN